jgi:uncharacterized protein YbjT (DUF2867 family)
MAPVVQQQEAPQTLEYAMHVLITGGTGVIGKPTVDRLLEYGHTVRLLSRNADRDASLWVSGVEPFPGSVGRDEDVRNSADGVDAILHIVGVVDEIPPEVTFENVNVQGTARMIREAERAGVGRFVYVSSLGADRGSSDYHESKRRGEEIVQRFPGNWLICRPGNVYGAGDQVVSLLLKVVRTLPVIPLIGDGEQKFQPVWAEDLATALARAVERDQPARRVLEIAGAEQVTLNELLNHLAEITGRDPHRLPVPEFIARAGADLANGIGMKVPINGDQIQMLLEENVIRPGNPNALTDIFEVEPTPLAKGLALLADLLPEKPPSEGVGALHRQRYWADIVGGQFDADGVFELVRKEFARLVPEHLLEVGSEPGTPLTLEEGSTLTMEIPLRGHIQVRVEEIANRAITCMTLEGHHLAGVIQFLVQEANGRIRFEIRSFTRAARVIDGISMATVGRRLQRATWAGMVEAVVERTQGTAPDGVEQEEIELPDREAARIDRWADSLVLRRQRAESYSSSSEPRKSS